jgi:WD40 repeat protein
MDFEVHRLRIGNWKPDAIKTVACDDKFSHNLAIGKENGEIEIVDPVDNFAMLLSVTGRDDFCLQALTWSNFISENGRNRLFGISLKGFLFEVNLNEGAIVHVTDCFSSAVWALQSSPRSDTLAVGCEDGVVRLFDFGHHRRAPDYLKSLTTSGARVLCLAYHQTLPKLVIGSADGVIRVLDETSGRVLQRLSATTPVGQSCSIWSIVLLRDETIVSGDSNGRVLVWDGQRGVATHCFTQHSADVLALAVSRDETQLFAAGVDGKVVCLRRGGSGINGSSHSSATSSSGASLGSSANGSSHSGAQAWQYTHSQRSHTHDVFCLALCSTSTHQRQLPAYHRKRKRTVGDLGILGSSQSLGEAGVLGQYSGYHSGDCLVSGGLDAKLCVYAVQDFARLRPLYLPFLPQGQDAVQHDAQYKVVALKQDRHIDLWLTGLDLQSMVGQSSNSSGESTTHSPEYALRVSVRGPEHVSCVALSPCGSLLACATPPAAQSTSSAPSLHVWHLLQSETAIAVKSRVALPATLHLGHVTSLSFVPERQQLAVFDGSAQRLYLLQFVKHVDVFGCEVTASIDCADDASNSQSLNHQYSNHGNTSSSSRSIGGAAPRKLVSSHCGRFLAYTSATRYIENHLPNLPPTPSGVSGASAATPVSSSGNHSAAASSNSNPTAQSAQSLRIVSSHTVTVVDVSRSCVAFKVKGLPSAAVDIAFSSAFGANGSTASPVPSLLVLQQNGSLKCFDFSQHHPRPLPLPCSALPGHSTAVEVRLPHRLRFPLQHMALQSSVYLASNTGGKHSNSSIGNQTHTGLFLYGQMQSVFVDLAQPQPETPRVVQPSYLMTPAQVALQQSLAQDFAQTHACPVRVLQASVPIGNGYNSSGAVGGNGESAAVDPAAVDEATVGSNNGNKKRKVQFVGGKETTTAAVGMASNDASNAAGSAAASPASSSNCCLVDVYRNVLHMGFLSFPATNATASAVTASGKKTKKSENTAVTDTQTSAGAAAKQVLVSE